MRHCACNPLSQTQLLIYVLLRLLWMASFVWDAEVVEHAFKSYLRQYREFIMRGRHVVNISVCLPLFLLILRMSQDASGRRFPRGWRSPPSHWFGKGGEHDAAKTLFVSHLDVLPSLASVTW